jgi:hypothetical protein
VALAALAILALDRFALTPIIEGRAALAEDLAKALEENGRARALFQRQKQLVPKWRQMVKDGLRAGAADAESQALHLLRGWAQDAGFALSSLRPEKVADRKGLLEITLRVAGAGPMKAVLGFLGRIETSAAPVRVTELQLGARKEGADDISLQMCVSTLCQAQQTAKKPAAPSGTPAGASAAPAAEDRSAKTPAETPLKEGQP